MRQLSIPSAGTATQNSAAVYVFDNAASRPDHTAVRIADGTGWRPVSSAEFAAQVLAVSKGLVAAGLQRGDRLALMSKTRYEWNVVDFAALAIGVVVVPVYETASQDQLRWILADAGACAIVIETATHAELVEALAEDLPALQHTWLIDDGAIATLEAAGTDIADEQVLQRLADTRPSDVASLIYTSGTTGQPKGCVITHANLLAEVHEVSTALDHLFNAANTTLLFLPLAHVFGRAISFGAVATGATLGHTADLANLVDHLSSFSPTFVLGVPRVFEKFYNGARQRAEEQGRGAIFERAARTAVAYSRAADSGRTPLTLKVRHAVFDRLVYGKLRAAFGGQCVAAISGGAPMGIELGHFFRGVGVPVFEGYGLTETTAGVCINKIGSMKIGSVGRPIPGMTVELADDGELLLSGPVVFDRYWNNEPATDEALTSRDGRLWFHTGDLASLDDDGFVTITGRKKELIVTAAGKNVAPSGLEDQIRSHWLVDQCLVVGDGKPYVAALITIDPDSWPTWLRKAGLPEDTELTDQLDDAALLAELQAAVDEANRAVSRAEAIKKFAVVPVVWTEATGDLTPSLKLRRSVVMQRAADDIATMYAASR